MLTVSYLSLASVALCATVILLLLVLALWSARIALRMLSVIRPLIWVGQLMCRLAAPLRLFLIFATVIAIAARAGMDLNTMPPTQENRTTVTLLTNHSTTTTTLEESSPFQKPFHFFFRQARAPTYADIVMEYTLLSETALFLVYVVRFLCVCLDCTRTESGHMRLVKRSTFEGCPDTKNGSHHTPLISCVFDTPSQKVHRL